MTRSEAARILNTTEQRLRYLEGSGVLPLFEDADGLAYIARGRLVLAARERLTMQEIRKGLGGEVGVAAGGEREFVQAIARCASGVLVEGGS